MGIDDGKFADSFDYDALLALDQTLDRGGFRMSEKVLGEEICRH